MTSGEITPKVRGAGTAEINNAYKVTIKGTRTVRLVNVKVGDTVAKGDMIYRLKKTSSTELEEAKKNLASLETEYEKDMFSGALSDADIYRIRQGNWRTTDSMQSQMSGVNGRLSNAEANVASAKNKVNSITGSGKKAQAARAAAEATLSSWENAVETITAERDKLIESITAEIDLHAKYEQIEEAKALVESLQKKDTRTKVVSPINGKIVSLAYSAGDETSADTEAAVIQPEGSALTVHFSVTKEQAANLKTGTAAEAQNAWYYEDFSARLEAINRDPENKDNRILVFSVVCPEVEAGDNVGLTVPQNSVYYDYIVPNSAIHEDNQGKFILIVESRQSPLGNRYVASRVNVDVLASDESVSAISALLLGYEYVITNATKPVSAGEQVRLAEDADV
ncbi:MAG: HlyD family efflux transporter periplasmic adaptor subunit [Lachnospiraceae bacterium]|nr:HlyD family efflux transporter periplasmic adaptor subunit [Lachnospiraceae bacterium]